MKLAAAFFVILALAATPASARPVSYKGGWMAMTMNDFGSNSVAALYSPTATTAIGPFADYYRDTDEALAGLQFNWLAHRWNNPDSQANIFLLSGAGVRDGGMGGYLGMEADWEDRRYYVSYENRYTDAGEDVKEEFQQKARIGIAPYVAEAGQLHTWLMLQVDHTPEDDDNWRATPLVRLFQGAYLGEAGISNRGEFLFNFTATF